MFEAQVSTAGNTGVVDLNIFPDAPMPFAIHLFGAETVEKWNTASDDSRAATAQQTMQDVLSLAILFGLTDSEAASAYNQTCRLSGIESHAVEYLGGGFDS